MFGVMASSEGDRPDQVPTRLALRSLGPRYWAFAASLGFLIAMVIAIPTRLVPNDWFSRMTPTRPLDYAFLVVSSAMLGMTFALSRRGRRVVATAPVGAGFATFLAVGCPVCNKLVVALIGTGGALSWFAPLQPFIGIAAIVALAAGLRHQLINLRRQDCPLTA